eukprot:CFRG2051T1
MTDSFNDWEAADEAGAFDKPQTEGIINVSKERYSNISNQVDTQFAAMDLVSNSNTSLSASSVKVQILRRPGANTPTIQPRIMPRSVTPPTNSSNSQNNTNASNNVYLNYKLQPKSSKSLAQREQDYAAAREKIFGKTDSPSQSTDKLSASNTSNRSSPRANTPTGQFAIPITAPEQTLYNTTLTGNKPLVSNIIREPKLPDGSLGFSFSRSTHTNGSLGKPSAEPIKR